MGAFFKPRSIKGKLIGIICLITIGTLAAGFVLIVAYDVLTFKRDMVESTRLIAQVVGEYSVSDLVFYDREAATETLGKLATLPAIEYACLFDRNGERFSIFGDEPDPADQEIRLEESVRFADGALHMVRPVVYRGENHGTLYLRASTHGLEAKILRHVAIVVAGMAMLVCLSLLLAFRLQRIISQPVLDLAALSRRISDTGDYSIRVPDMGEDELGVLCENFNEMLDQLHLRELERDQAVHRTEEKSHFLATMSHELRTPLNSIIGFSEILLSRGDVGLDERQMKFLTNIHRSGQHLLGIINDILDLSKVEAGKMELFPEPVSVPAVIEGVAAVMKGTADKRQVEIRFEGASDLPPIVADPMKLKQVFYNLLSNAVKFSPEHSAVRITAGSLEAAESPLGEDSVAVAVIDKGIGISTADQEKIFQPFRQADSGDARRFEGTGLGLTLVRSLVDKHRGAVQLESERGKGSTFTVVLPREFRGGAEDEEKKKTTAVDQLLVVESDRATMREIKKVLASEGFEIFEARNAVQAGDVLGKIKPAVMAVELGLSGGGWEALLEIKMQRKAVGIPVVLYSALEDGNRGLVLGVDDCFFKPLGLERMVSRIEELVGNEDRDDVRVLLIDEDPYVHENLEHRLVPKGFRLDHTHSGEQGLGWAADSKPDLIVLDVFMERMGGFEVGIRLRSRPGASTIPMIVYAPTEMTRENRRLFRATVTDMMHEGESAKRPLDAAIRRLLARQPKE
jgi:signal transduction histidine kinase/DNA-binding response OmpR family regulator